MATGMLNDCRREAGPNPESWRSCAECNAPAATMTSFVAYTVWRGAEELGANCKHSAGNKDGDKGHW